MGLVKPSHSDISRCTPIVSLSGRDMPQLLHRVNLVFGKYMAWLTVRDFCNGEHRFVPGISFVILFIPLFSSPFFPLRLLLVLP